ncbi:MAG TPA: hypothetical protein PKO38_01350 [Bacillota bacterium]|jgi:hypothetical protein|nr:hypothetical protein [Bacillota bacterium]HOB86318.1 hypothetical protein [Bacillota bacterium]HOP69515.1 hypothetical protein [Bacillota bacterium]HPT34466.1 hypothetical protein [Bacillota bacterium]HPZ64619.1 hypothetical protein [Bacillota bacterium]
MNRFLVIEARRLLPLLFLLVLLVSLSIYDNFFRAEQPVAGTDEQLENLLTFVTADRGELSAPPTFRVIATLEEWKRFKESYPGLPDYPFNSVHELAIGAINGEIKNILLFPQEEDLVQVQVRVESIPRAYHVVTVEREKIGPRSSWLFLDENDQILAEVALPSPEEEAPSD